ncbi:hypothetical protein B0H34DRAFT_805116, partial [Crassisporium funariophilum]
MQDLRLKKVSALKETVQELRDLKKHLAPASQATGMASLRIPLSPTKLETEDYPNAQFWTKQAWTNLMKDCADRNKDFQKLALLTDNDGAQPLINARPHPTSTEATSSSTKRKSDNMASSFSKRKHQKKKVKTTMHIAATNIINLDEDSDNSGLEYVHEIQPPPLGPASKPPLNTTTNKPVHPVRQSLDLMPTA